MRASFGHKSRGNSIGKKQSGFKKGVKTLGLALVAGAGIYAAINDNTHKDHEVEQSKQQELQQQLDDHREELAAEGAKPAPAPAVQFGQGGKGGKLDKVADVLQVASAGVEAAQDVDEATGKFGKAKAAAKGAKQVKDKAKEVGAKDIQAKFEAGLLTDQQAKKFVQKQQKDVEGKKRVEDCDKKYPKGVGNKKERAKKAGQRKICYKTGS